MNKIDPGRGGLHQILEPIMLPDTNIKFFKRECTDEEPLIFIPNDKSYVEVLGHRLETGENFKSFEEFGKWLQHIKEVEEENEQLLKQMREFGEYVLTKYEESKLNAQYIDGVRYPSIQERVYEDILGRFELN